MATGHELRGFQANRPFGWRFDWTSVSTITAVPTGIYSRGYVPLFTDAEADGLFVEWSDANLTMALSTTGAGGLHDDHSEAANTGYDVYFAWGKTAALKLFSVPTGTAVNATKISNLTGGTFTHWSRVTWFVRNDGSSNIKRFQSIVDSRSWQYTDIDFVNDKVLALGTSSAVTALSATGWAPTNDTGHWIPLGNPNNNDTTNNWLNLFSDSAGTQFVWQSSQVKNAAGGVLAWRGLMAPCPVTGHYVAWNASLTSGAADFYVSTVWLA